MSQQVVHPRFRARFDVRASSRAVAENPACAAEPASVPSRTRLTLRGRLLVVAAVALLPFAAFTAGRASADQGSAVEPTRVVVGPGQTLWGLAGSAAPGADVGDTVAHIMEMNSLETAIVHPGQELLLPPQS